jgi:mono/diheme cytochrome c family protein
MFKSGVLIAAAAVSAVSAQTIKQSTAERTSPASGEQMYVSYCAACHGKDARGNGPAATALKKTPTDLTALSKNNGGSFPALRVRSAIAGDVTVAAHGSADMPVWGTLFRRMGDEAQVALRLSNLIAHIEKLQK